MEQGGESSAGREGAGVRVHRRKPEEVVRLEC